MSQLQLLAELRAARDVYLDARMSRHPAVGALRAEVVRLWEEMSEDRGVYRGRTAAVARHSRRQRTLPNISVRAGSITYAEPGEWQETSYRYRGYLRPNRHERVVEHLRTTIMQSLLHIPDLGRRAREAGNTPYYIPSRAGKAESVRRTVEAALARALSESGADLVPGSVQTVLATHDNLEIRFAARVRGEIHSAQIVGHVSV